MLTTSPPKVGPTVRDAYTWLPSCSAIVNPSFSAALRSASSCGVSVSTWIWKPGSPVPPTVDVSWIWADAYPAFTTVARTSATEAGSSKATAMRVPSLNSRP